MKNHGVRAIGRVRFRAKILKVIFRTSIEGSFHADHNAANPSFISDS